MTVRAFVWPSELRFADRAVEHHGVFICLPGILPIGSTLELPVPTWWLEADPIEVQISGYRFDQHGILIVHVNNYMPIIFATPAWADMPDLVAIGWMHVCQVWPTPGEKFVPPTFDRVDDEDGQQGDRE